MGKSVKERRKLKKHSPNRPFKKIDPEKLKEYIKANPEAYLYEIAVIFNCCPTAIRKALKRLNITRKNRQHAIMSKTLKK